MFTIFAALCALLDFALVFLSAIAITIFLILALIHAHSNPTPYLWGYVVSNIVYSVTYRLAKFVVDPQGLR